MVVAPYTVGLSSPLEELMQLIDVKCKGTQVLGLHGMGGIGKTTLSKALYNKLVGHFEYHSFISNVRETCAKQNGLVSLQNRLTGDLSAGRMTPVNDVNAGKRAIKQILHEKRVLIVLDDVDDLSQLTALIESRDWFYEGSRIIVSTRDQKVLSNRHFTDLYEVKELGLSDSIKLFSYHAFRREKPPETFLNLSKQIVSLTGRLPLALEVFGSLLIDTRSVGEWDDALQKLKQIRPNHLHDVLKISFNGLDDQEKCLFLDIACSFLNLNMKKDDVIDVMEGCGVRAKIAISVLVERSLIRISEDGSLRMHDQIRDMGRQIVLDENLLDPGKRSRLWDHREILDVLQGGTGTGSILGITLDLDKNNFPKDESSLTIHRRTPNTASTSTCLKKLYKEYFQRSAYEEGELVLCTKAFQPMVNLRLLQLRNVKLEGNFIHLPAKVKWLQWKNCPLKYLPSDCPRELTVLDLSESKIERVWCNNKIALRNLYNFSVPGSEIPDWFTPEEVCFSKRKHHAIKAVIMAVVVSINHQILDDKRDQIPATIDIQAEVLRSNKPVYTTALVLIGVPNTHEDQFYLCRYNEYGGLVLMLEDGDKIQVAMRDPPIVKGVELKKCGIHLVFENDDDYNPHLRH